MKTCKGCGNEYRKSKHALLVFGDGSVSNARVCPDCIKRAIRVVAVLRAPILRIDRKRTDDDVARVLRMLTTYAKFAKSEGLDGRSEGLEAAIETVRRELGVQS